MPTTYGNEPDFIRTDEDRTRLIDAMAEGNRHLPRIDRNCPTWKAIKKHIEDQVSGDLMPTLRNREIDHGQTQYARGGMDYLYGLLQFGGEDV